MDWQHTQQAVDYCLERAKRTPYPRRRQVFISTAIRLYMRYAKATPTMWHFIRSAARQSGELYALSIARAWAETSDYPQDAPETSSGAAKVV